MSRFEKQLSREGSIEIKKVIRSVNRTIKICKNMRSNQQEFKIIPIFQKTLIFKMRTRSVFVIVEKNPA